MVSLTVQPPLPKRQRRFKIIRWVTAPSIWPRRTAIGRALLQYNTDKPLNIPMAGGAVLSLFDVVVIMSSVVVGWTLDVVILVVVVTVVVAAALFVNDIMGALTSRILLSHTVSTLRGNMAHCVKCGISVKFYFRRLSEGKRMSVRAVKSKTVRRHDHRVTIRKRYQYLTVCPTSWRRNSWHRYKQRNLMFASYTLSSLLEQCLQYRYVTPIALYTKVDA